MRQTPFGKCSMKTILIVDPECARDNLAAILVRRGFSALVVGEGRKALDIICSGATVDMVLWARMRPASFDRWAAPWLRSWWRRWTFYRCLLYTSPSPRDS